MKERPILFNSEMVRAILDGRKTQTRRVVNKLLANNFADPQFSYGDGTHGRGWYVSESDYPEEGSIFIQGPYGKPGDRLWVRECFAVNDIRYASGRLPPFSLADLELVYRADGEMHEQFEQADGHLPWRPSIHMPRWASRITLEITDVRVERLQEISEEDALAEGMVQGSAGWGVDLAQANSQDLCLGTARFAFANLINCIHGGPHWNLDCDRNGKIRPDPLWIQNPWVWVVEFKRLQ